MASLALGTVQLGMGYGAANTAGMPSAKDATEIVHFAAENGIKTFDTAHSYELSQERLGNALALLPTTGTPQHPRVVTKVDGSLHHSADEAEIIHKVDESVETSMRTLNMEKLDVLCLHYWSAHGPKGPLGPVAWNRVLEHKNRGNVCKVGTSTYSPEEVVEALDDPNVEHIQLPFNLLDYRWREADISNVIGQHRNVSIHARSVFLQGILVSTHDRWPSKFGTDIANEVLEKLEQLVTSLNRKSKVDLCIAYARAQPWITEVLIGAETRAQLAELVELASLAPLTLEEVQRVDKVLPRVPLDLLLPSNW